MKGAEGLTSERLARSWGVVARRIRARSSARVYWSGWSSRKMRAFRW